VATPCNDGARTADVRRRQRRAATAARPTALRARLHVHRRGPGSCRHRRVRR
jgi:hypothetical protein